MDDYRKPVPATLNGARGVLTAGDAKRLVDGGALLIDVYPRAPKPPNLPASTVWREPPHRSIAGAVWLPNVGYGVLAPEVQTYFETQLAAISQGDRTRPLIFFCLRDCWMSWNATKRALSLGYANSYWFPEGVDGWEEFGQPVANIQPTLDLTSKF